MDAAEADEKRAQQEAALRGRDAIMNVDITQHLKQYIAAGGKPQAYPPPPYPFTTPIAYTSASCSGLLSY